MAHQLVDVHHQLGFSGSADGTVWSADEAIAAFRHGRTHKQVFFQTRATKNHSKYNRAHVDDVSHCKTLRLLKNLSKGMSSTFQFFVNPSLVSVSLRLSQASESIGWPMMTKCPLLPGSLPTRPANCINPNNSLAPLNAMASAASETFTPVTRYEVPETIMLVPFFSLIIATYSVFPSRMHHSPTIAFCGNAINGHHRLEVRKLLSMYQTVEQQQEGVRNSLGFLDRFT